MKFSQLLAVAFATSVQAQSISAQKTVDNIKSITTMSKSLDSTVKSVTLVQSFQTGPEVIDAFHAIVRKATKDYNEMTGSGYKKRSVAGRIQVSKRDTMYTEAEQQMICAAFADLATATETLMSDMESKDTDFETSLEASDAATAMQDYERIMDQIGTLIINEVPTCAAQAMKSKAAMDKKTEEAVQDFNSGLP